MGFVVSPNRLARAPPVLFQALGQRAFIGTRQKVLPVINHIEIDFLFLCKAQRTGTYTHTNAIMTFCLGKLYRKRDLCADR